MSEHTDLLPMRGPDEGGPVFDLKKLEWLNGEWLRKLTVADFVGRCNILSGRRESETEFRCDSGLVLPVDTAAGECKDASAFALRPERITLQAGGAGGVQGRLKAVTYMGAQTEYVVAVGADASSARAGRGAEMGRRHARTRALHGT